MREPGTRPYVGVLPPGCRDSKPLVVGDIFTVIERDEGGELNLGDILRTIDAERKQTVLLKLVARTKQVEIFLVKNTENI